MRLRELVQIAELQTVLKNLAERLLVEEVEGCSKDFLAASDTNNRKTVLGILGRSGELNLEVNTE